MINRLSTGLVLKVADDIKILADYYVYDIPPTGGIILGGEVEPVYQKEKLLMDVLIRETSFYTEVFKFLFVASVVQ